MDGFVGDVKYSLLEPKIFLAEHPGWALLQGQDLDPTDPLYQLGIQRLPDARGIFIRGMNVGRPKETGDADGDRAIGQSQADTVGPHQHDLPHNLLQRGENMKGGDGGAFINPIGASQSAVNNGLETRPKNIALYIYVKIK